jgi:hypothetical protein
MEVVRNFMSSSMSAVSGLMSRAFKISWKWVVEPNKGLSKFFRDSSVGTYPSWIDSVCKRRSRSAQQAI